MRCPKCAGCMLFSHDEDDPSYCINCGFRANAPLPEAFVSSRFFGTDQCEECGERRMHHARVCRSCHGQRIALGMKRKS